MRRVVAEEAGIAVVDAMLPPGPWAVRHFGSVNLKDARLNRRVLKVAEAMAARPSASIPDQCGTWAGTKGAYRLFADPCATFDAISEGHWRQTRRSAAGVGEGVVLFVQDTTWLSFGHHPATRGLGRHGKGQSRGDLGLHLHSVLAVRPTGPENGEAQAAILGLAHARLWARPASLCNADQAARSARRKSGDRESLRWGAAVREVGAAPAGCGVRFLHVGAREADLFDLYEQTTRLNRVGFVIRVTHDRNALEGHGTPDVIKLERVKGSRLKELIRATSASPSSASGMRLEVAANNGRLARTAELKIAHAAVTLYAPQARGRNPKALRCWCVRVFEPQPPGAPATRGERVEPIEWILLSSEPVEDVADARRVVRYYHWRWLIEEYHRCLKSGCRVEQRQLASMDALAPLVGLSSIVGTRLLQLKNDARLHPDAAAHDHASPEMVRVLCRLTGQDPRTLSLREFTRGVARQGGFLARRRDGDPGWQTLWRGWQKLDLMCEGWRLAKLAEDMGKG